jgi:uncharacterized membrane protein YoaK (UPF0700 family)
LRAGYQRTKSSIALCLTFAAGYVDIVGYLSVYHTFTAHMTGNTVHLGNYLFSRNQSEVAIAATVLIAFIVGSLAGRILIEAGARHKIRSIASLTLGFEAALVVIVAAQFPGAMPPDSPLHPFIVLALLAAAMGLQTATITRVGALTVHTTFVTGMINKLAQLLSHALFDTYDIAMASSRSGHNFADHERQTLRKTGFIFSIWCLYLLGAVAARGGSQNGGCVACTCRWQSFVLQSSPIRDFPFR